MPGGTEDTKAAYEHVISIRIATPLMVLNYASMLQQINMFEDSFRVFERAVALFQWPNSYEIWVTYLSTMI